MMNKTLVTIVALSVDTRHAVLYLTDGSTMTLAQGDARLPQIVADARPALARGNPVQVDVTPVVVQRSEFPDAEKGTKGVIKFFRVAKTFLKSLVNTESPEAVPEEVAHVSPLEIGVFPGKEATNQGTKEEACGHDMVRPEDGICIECGEQTEDTSPAVDDLSQAEADAAVKARLDEAAEENATTSQATQPLTNDQKLDAARSRMQQLVSNSVGTDRAEFHTPLDEQTETIVAVHETTGAIIPDAHKLARQLRASQKLQSYVGFERFIERLSAIIDERGHSVEDLMKFIEKGDLPIADDGCIVIFKRLNSAGKDTFVDVHTGRVQQKVGSYVFMRAGLVDPNRREDCSNGLHVATLGYIRTFSGNVTVLAKVRPEDVFAVPEYAHTKMRVCGYHILVNLPDNLRRLVNEGRSISSDPQGAVLLANVLKGNHIGITQHVEIGGHQGQNVTITKVEGAVSADQLPALELATAQTLDMQEALEAKAPVAEEIRATELVQPKQAPKEERVIKSIMSNPKETSREAGTSTGKPSQKEQATALLQKINGEEDPQARLAFALELLKFKKQARKSWAALGLPENVDVTLKAIIEPKAPSVQAVQVSKPAPVETVETGKADWLTAEKLLAEGLGNAEVAKKTGLSKDQVYRLKKKLSK
jgi:hypothetical protein